jgi:hypothetical protein
MLGWLNAECRMLNFQRFVSQLKIFLHPQLFIIAQSLLPGMQHLPYALVIGGFLHDLAHLFG